MSRAGTWMKMFAAGAVICIGGPMFVSWVRPTEEELFQKFNPDLQKRNLENRERRQQDFDQFVTNLKVHAKSDKHIWDAARDAQIQQKEMQDAHRKREKEEARIQKEEIQKELSGGSQ